MRHFLSLLLGIVLAPVIWGLTSYGGSRLLEAGESIGPNNFDTQVGLGCLAGAGLALGLLLGTRLSPLGPLLAGALHLGGGAWYLFAPENFLDLVEKAPDRIQNALPMPATVGWAWVVGIAMLVPLAVPSRWRRKPAKTAGLSDWPPRSASGSDGPESPLPSGGASDTVGQPDASAGEASWPPPSNQPPDWPPPPAGQSADWPPPMADEPTPTRTDPAPPYPSTRWPETDPERTHRL